jgi:ATP-dependent 26S proteasome regulatory subunit
VKAVFSLASKIAPSVIFVDEVSFFSRNAQENCASLY